MASLIHEVNNLSLSENSLLPVEFETVLHGQLDSLDRQFRGEISTKIMTGIDELDERTGGFESTDLIFIGGRPGMGKTELALSMIDGMTKHDDEVLFFTMEMSNDQIARRMVAKAAGLPVSKFKKLDLNDEDWGRISDAYAYLENKKIYLLDASGLTIEQISSISTSLKRKNPKLKAIFIDYLGLIKKSKAERHDLAVAEISSGLKFLAKKLHCPVVALSQLSRDVDKRPINQRRPNMADLRDSGSLEADANFILFTYREGAYNPNSPAKNYAEIIIEKNRDGEKGTVYMEFKNGHYIPTDQISAAEVSRMQQQSQSLKSRRYAEKAF